MLQKLCGSIFKKTDWKVVHLVVGQKYKIAFTNPTKSKWETSDDDIENKLAKSMHELLFIKVTPKGYNFLNLKTSKCVMSHHYYVAQSVMHENDPNKLLFFVPSFIHIQQTSK